MALIVTCRSGRHSTPIQSDVHELKAFRQAQEELGRPVNLSDWEKLQEQLQAWRQSSRHAEPVEAPDVLSSL